MAGGGSDSWCQESGCKGGELGGEFRPCCALVQVRGWPWGSEPGRGKRSTFVDTGGGLGSAFLSAFPGLPDRVLPLQPRRCSLSSHFIAWFLEVQR